MQNIYSIYSRLNLFYETLLVKLKFLLLFSQLIKKKKNTIKTSTIVNLGSDNKIFIFIQNFLLHILVTLSV